MSIETEHTLTREERDLLIELRTEMRGLRIDVNNITKDTTERIKDLEVSKFDSKEFSDTWGKQIADHEARLRVSETFQNQSNGMLYVIQGIVAFVISIVVMLVAKKLGV